jgi:hypothetical protein
MKIFARLIFYLIVFQVNAQFNPNYDECRVPDYELPELLKTESGTSVTTVEEWESNQRPELLDLFKSQMYGKVPEHNLTVKFKLLEYNRLALNGNAVRKQISILFSNESESHEVGLLVYLPKNIDGSVPVFLGYNFYGNHTIFPDPDIHISKSWVRDNSNFLIFDYQADEKSRGCRAGRWPLLRILERGYGLAVMYYGDIDPDYDDGFKNGIHKLIYQGETKPAADEWGSISPVEK